MLAYCFALLWKGEEHKKAKISLKLIELIMLPLYRNKKDEEKTNFENREPNYMSLQTNMNNLKI